ncbi:hypothetical protein [Planktothrix agardhii]|jgi:hypothetical protein|uniref:hypothetical protein n=1 Tax=Planktothrix agardhii TaxID=1160 RepID=UPI000920AB76|nr:hypothetical protein [Planktothrix agardhii]MCF3608074.1 hypothetical protein [Planktothrix agardhii 1033]MDS1347902.1 hypothetical protein [Planktothrix agardhii NRERC-751]MEA5563332.1 hypothetical protein [Planktothrix agardhii UHCC 0887]OIP73403.1 MAG: hypothetical protein AUK43_00660 [Oscillatoriales cyanobacterium CG2_30_40_61]
MSISKSEKQQSLKSTNVADLQMRAIAYSLDTLIPGIYIWLGALKIRIGGSEPEDSYPGTIHSPIGIALVFPGYRIYSTYQGSYDP